MADPLPSFEEAVASGAPAASSSQAGGFRTTFACMTRFNVDHLHLADFPREEVEQVQACVQRVWPKGIQDVRQSPTPGGWDIKIGGFPWSAVQCGPGDGRVLVGQLLEHLYDRGWVMHTSVMAFQHVFYGGECVFLLSPTGAGQVNMLIGLIDTLIFRHQMPPPPPCEWLVVAFDKVDRLRIMPPPPDDLQASLLKWLGSQVQRCGSPKDDHLEIKLNGLPWNATAQEGVRTHLVLLRILDALQTTGFALYGAIHQQQVVIQDVLVVHRQKDWRPGQPVWQR